VEGRRDAPAVPARQKVKPQTKPAAPREEVAAADSLAKQSAPAAAAEPGAAAERRAQSSIMAAAEPPERWIERIAELRKLGKDDEADRQLAEFRKRYPEFRIPPETLEKVERR